MNKLSILIYSLASGGAERVVSILLNEFKDRYDITLVLMNETVFYDIPKDIEVIYLEKSHPTENGINKLLKLPLLAWKYKMICMEHNIDISLSFMNRPNYVNIVAKIFGMPSKVLISERAMPSLQHKFGIQGRINKLLIRYLYNKADITTANSLGNSNDLSENFSCKNVVTINNPFDLEQIELLSQENIDSDENKFKFISVGRLDSGKNPMLLINAIQNINAVLYIIGDGVLKAELENHIIEKQLQDKVILLGTQANPYKYISKANCFVFGSSYEGFPNVLLEALTCGLPVISTDCQSGPREILAPNSDIGFQLQDDIELCEYGVLTPINNTYLMQKAMKLIMNDENLRTKYKNKTLQRAKAFDKDKIIKEWLKVL